MTSALIIVDMQYDFLPGGALGVPDGFDVIGPLIEAGDKIGNVVFTRDWHPANHVSFSERPKFEDFSWPPHCVQGTDGAELHERLQRHFRGAPVVTKGNNRTLEAYSGFEGMMVDQTLVQWLDDRAVSDVYVGGLAFDYCVKNTAIDAARNSYGTTVLTDATRPVKFETGIQAALEMDRYSVGFKTTDDL